MLTVLLDSIALTRLVGLATTVAASSVLCGCAVGRFGTLAAHVQLRGDLSDVTVYSIGLHLRARNDDPGAHLGFSKRIYTFAGADLSPPGWYVLRVPLPACTAVAQDLSTFGIDLATAPPAGGLSLGYVHTQIFARVPPDASVLIQYGPGLRIDKLSTLTETTSCATH